MTDRSQAVVLLWLSLDRFGDRVSVFVHLTCVHIISPRPICELIVYTWKKLGKTLTYFKLFSRGKIIMFKFYMC